MPFLRHGAERIEELRYAESVSARAAADRLDLLGAVDLSEEAGKRVFAACAVAGGTKQCVPVAIVDSLPEFDLSGEDGDGDFL
jgi:hypothetical protein